MVNKPDVIGQSNDTNRLAAVIPAFNEEQFIEDIILKTKTYVDSVIVVDDGSTDSTGSIAEAAGAVLVKHPKNMGKGAALNSGFRKAFDLGAEIIITLEADGRHRPEEISAMIQPIRANEADVVIGSRYLIPQSNAPKIRVWGHKVFNLLTNILSNTLVSDSQSGYRAFSAQAVEPTPFYSNGFSVKSEIQFIVNKYQLRLVEVPITIRYVDDPQESLLGHGLEVLVGILRLTGHYRPQLIYGVLGTALLFIGWVIMNSNAYQASKNLALWPSLLSGLFFILGAGCLGTAFFKRRRDEDS